MYFGTVDHENDHSTAEITDGLDVPELAPGVNVSRGSLLVPSIFIASSPATIDQNLLPRPACFSPVDVSIWPAVGDMCPITVGWAGDDYVHVRFT
jgi:hypothetical protein